MTEKIVKQKSSLKGSHRSSLKRSRRLSHKNNQGSPQSQSPFTFTIVKSRDDLSMLDNPQQLLAFTREFSPVSGSEHPYEPEKWNNKNAIRTTHNCYTYALGKIRPKLKSKAQPGYASGHNYIDDTNDYNCKSFYQRVKKDNPFSYLEGFDQPCSKNYYKVFLALDVGNDYHWWRQDRPRFEAGEKGGYWSHKPGSTDVTNVDASGVRIKNPMLADRKYPTLNYSTPCFFMCINKDLSRSISSIYPKYS